MKQLTLRLPDEMHAALRSLADREHRSMHAEVLHILSPAIAREEVREVHAIPPPPEDDSPPREARQL